MITAKEAYKKVLKKFPDKYCDNCTEYGNLYVFSMIPKGMKNVFDSLFSVDKNTGEIKGFQPSSISAKEYENGKRILDYK